MPTIARASFLDRMRGKSLKEADFRHAFPSVDIRGLANARGVIEASSANLEKLWTAIDRFDRDGSSATVGGALPVQIIEWVLANASGGTAEPAPGNVPGPGSVPGSGADPGVWRRVAEAGDRSITARTRAHRDAIATTGVGRYYGDHGAFHAQVRANDRAGIKARIEAWTQGRWTLAAISYARVDIRGPGGAIASLKESSCIGWVMENAKAAYEAAGQGVRFSQIEQRMRDADQRGTVLCEELQTDGWTAVFYSPRTAADLQRAGESGKLGALNMARAGSRVWRATTVDGSRGVRCASVVSGYRDTTPDSVTESLLLRLERTPFFVGVANGGVHTFVGHRGNVCDFHWTAGPEDELAMTEESVRRWEWDTGLYMVPPGYWRDAAEDL